MCFSARLKVFFCVTCFLLSVFCSTSVLYCKGSLTILKNVLTWGFDRDVTSNSLCTFQHFRLSGRRQNITALVVRGGNQAVQKFRHCRTKLHLFCDRTLTEVSQGLACASDSKRHLVWKREKCLSLLFKCMSTQSLRSFTVV